MSPLPIEEIRPERPEAFMDPEHGLPRDAVLVRPSLWAAVSGILQVLLPLLFAFLPVAFFYIFFGRAPPGDPDPSSSPVERFGEIAQLVIEFAFVGVGIIIPAVRILFTRYAFGPHDLRVRRQLLERHEERVEWQKVTALRYHRTILDRVFRLERLDVVAYGRRGTTLKLVGLRKDSGFHQVVARRMRETATVGALFEND